MLKDLIVEILAQWDEHDLFLCPTTVSPPEIRTFHPVTLDPKELNHRQAITFGFTPPFESLGSRRSRCRSDSSPTACRSA